MTQRDKTSEPGHDEHELTGLEIAVIGMAGRFPGAHNINEFWENLRNGKESVTFFSDKELAEAGVESSLINNPNYVKAMPVLADKEYFDAYFFGYTPAEAEVMAPQVRIYHECAWAALEDAGYDPLSYKGMMGCYAGSSSSFEWQALTYISGMNRRLGIWESHLLSAKDNLGAHLAYKLDLKGPGFTFFSACSTSLVAVHLACRAILTGECSMALAGGIALDTLGKPGYLYQEGMILSPDGHCRAFDAATNGSIFGEGVGVVVLKRLREAVKDGDHIYASVKGSAVNNDGIGKVGYTAPGARGQRDVVKLALKAAKVPAESISYVETHGTGTNLGDPVEIAALQEAFNTDKKRFCAVGSVKTNIGHLDAAAGIAGFIKTVLALKYRLIPPSLHFQTPNPRIDFDHSPFYVNTQPREWKNGTGPLRAGVSSFGIGGANAHVVLEAWSGIERSREEREGREERDYQLILLSAKTETALDKMTENLADYLKKNPDLNLADAAYTLQVGRRTFRHRCMVVSSTVEEIVQVLTHPGDHNDNKVKTFSAAGENQEPPVVFMFPGLGSQYVGMGLDLYKSEPTFRREMDRCFDILQLITGYKFKEILYPSLEDKMSNRSYRTNIIDQAEFAQPIIFIFEYALVKLLTTWGIAPQAMIGYSFGEYTAACAAGVFSLEDALQLVVSRGNLIQKVPVGAMLSVPLPRQEVVPLLAGESNREHEISLAIDNGPSCIVAGPPAAVDAFERKLKEKKLICMRAPVSRALHTPMMAAIAEEFRELAASLHLNIPQIPYISNVTGNWIHRNQAVDPAYWATHLQQTVQFGDGVKLLVNKWLDAIFVEVGPGSDLSALVVRYIDQNPEQRILHLVRRPQRKAADDNFLLDKIGRLWLYGIKPDWQAFYAGEKKQRIPLPGYPFDRHYYPAQGDPFALGMKMLSPQPLLEQLEKKPDKADWFYLPSWKRTMPPSPNNLPQSGPICWLLLGNPGGLGTRLAQQLTHMTAGKKEAIIVDEGEIDPRHPAAYDALLAELKRQGKAPGKIIHLWGLGCQRKEVREENKIETFDVAQESGLYSLVYLSKAIHNLDHGGNFEIIVISSGIHEVTGSETLFPEKSTILAAVKTIPQEYPYISCRNIDIAIPEQGSWQEKKLVDRLVVEISVPTASAETVIAYRDEYRWAQVYEPVRLEEIPVGAAIPRLKQRGVYLVTGGLGGMGFTLAGYLARDARARLILTGRSFMPPRQQWEQWLASHKEDDSVSIKIQKIKELEEAGAEVSVFSVDVADREEMARVIAIAEEQFGPINGVVHTAGILGGGAASFNIISKLDKTAFKEQFQPKVYGLLALEEILGNRVLDFCLLTSSLSPILGGLGFTAYSAANQFLDAFVYKYNRDHFRAHAGWLSLNWGDWQPWNAADRKNVIGATINQLNMSPDEGIETFRRILFHCGVGQIVVSSGDLQVRIDQWVKLKTLREQDKPTPVVATAAVHRRSHLSDAYVPPRDQIENTLAEIWQRLFGFDQIGIQDDFFELGGDSLKAITLAARIHKELNIEIPLTEFFENPSIAKQARYIHESATAKAGSYEIVEAVEKKEYYALSSAQKRLYILQQMQKEFTGYNDQMAFVLEGELEKGKLEQSFRKLLERHESLRTSFQLIDDEPVQRIHPVQAEEPGIEYCDFATECLGTNFIRPFDLSRPPLLRIGVIKETGTRHILLVDIHHIVTDGTSMEILIKEFKAFYDGEELAPLRVQYKDYARWQSLREKQEAFKQQEAYWLKAFAGEIPVLNLPTDYPRPMLQGFEGDRVRFELSGDETNGLKQMALAHGTTLFMLLLALFNVLLSRLSSREDIIIGVPVAGRRHADLERIVGMFINILALRNNLVGEKPFVDFLFDVKERTLGAFENQEYQFEYLVEKVAVARDMSRNPLFDVMFVLQNFSELTPATPGKETKSDSLDIKEWDFDLKSSKFDLTLTAYEQGGRLFFYFEYCTRLFKEESILRFISYFKAIVSSVLGEPAKKIAEIDILSEEERRQLLIDFNNTIAAYPDDKTIPELFAAQVEKIPDHIALVGAALSVRPVGPAGLVSLTYRELNEHSDGLARLLNEKGVLADNIVSIMMEPSVEMIIGILGIWKAGDAYLPIDPEYPEGRIDYMLKDSNAKLSINEKFFRGSVPAGAIFQKSPPCFVNLAYIIYTSGTTGKPKGVIVEHRNLTAYLYAVFKEFDLTASDTSIQLASYAFDAFIEEVFPVLLKGGKLVIPVRSEIMDVYALSGLILKHHVNIIDCTPLLLNEFDKLEIFTPGVNRTNYIFLSGGDVLKKEHVANLLKVGRVYNTYGPTESTVCATYYHYTGDCAAGDLTSVPIGKPISNYKIYILDEHLNPAPIGVVGEICVSGPGVARGYLNRPELTSEKFISLHHSSFIINHLKLYRTGDLGRWLSDGNIEFLGRIDHQVNIRGFRIELGEIESELLKHDLIKEAMVIDMESEIGEKFLCGYIVPEEEFDLSGLKAYLSKSLPDYMIPSYFMHIEAIPLNSNGKLDRGALPARAVQAGGDYISPSNETEERLVGLWAEVLAIKKNKISMDENFFELGGHSLKVTILGAKIHKSFNVKIPIVEIFRLPTVRQLAQYIENSRVSIEDKYAAVEPVEKKEYYVLSSAQQRLYILQQMDPGGNTYNVSYICRLEGELDIMRLETVFRKLIHRHESLRTSFIMVDEEPVQRIHAEVNFKIEILEFRDQESGGVGVGDFIRTFDLSCAPLMRVGVIKEAETRHILAVDIPHIVTDGASMELLINEFMVYYGGGEVLPLRVQYKDYACWQNSEKKKEAFRKQETYWLRQFEEGAPVLEFPLDFPRPAVQSFEGASIAFEIPNPVANGLQSLAAKPGGTLYMALLAVTTIFLSKISNQEDIVVGSPVAGRRHVDLERIMGMFVNTLVMRNNPVGAKRFSTFLEEVKQGTLEAFENQEYQFEDLVERVMDDRDPGRNPLFDVIFAMQNMQTQPGDTTKVGIGELRIKPYNRETRTAKFDISLLCSVDGEGLFFTFEYCTRLFKQETAQRFIDYFKNIISAIVENPGWRIKDIEILTEPEKQRLLKEFNDTGIPYPNEKTIPQLFGEQVEKTPDHIAILGAALSVRPVGLISLSYRELNGQSDRLAHLLREKGVLADSIVGIMSERSIEMITGILGILKSGGAYLPIDPEYPAERIDYMFKDSAAKIVLTTNEITSLSTECLFNFHQSPFPINHSRQLAYIIYTSGSTGKPKGVMVEHRNVVRLVRNTNYVEFRENDRLLQTGALEFDASTFEIWGSLLNGMTLCAAGKDEILNPAKLKENIWKYDICTMWLTSPLFNRLIAVDVEIFAGLRNLLVGGDVLSTMYINRIRRRFPRLNIINGYGPTENTTFSTTIRIDKEYTQRIPIGKPISNSTAYVVDRAGHLSPVGVVGELLVGGDGVSRGYLNNPELTAEKFIDFHHSSFIIHHLKLYCTGDLVRWLVDPAAQGAYIIEFLGRVDQQVKIRGFRIELGEVEAELLKHELVKEVVVIDRESDTDEKYLCGYIVAEEKFELPVLKEFLSKRLPNYMIPSYFMRIESTPLNANGKLDRKALPEPGITPRENYAAPGNEIEEKMATIWSEVLGVEKNKISIDAGFFDLGGHSLKATVMVAKIHKVFNLKLQLIQVFRAPTIRGLALLIEALNWVNPVDTAESTWDINFGQESEEVIL